MYNVFIRILFNMFRLPSICVNKSYRMPLFIATTCHFYHISNFFALFFTLFKKVQLPFLHLLKWPLPTSFFTHMEAYIYIFHRDLSCAFATSQTHIATSQASILTHQASTETSQTSITVSQPSISV